MFIYVLFTFYFSFNICKICLYLEMICTELYLININIIIFIYSTIKNTFHKQVLHSQYMYKTEVALHILKKQLSTKGFSWLGISL
jgi:hypothetical protein